MKIPRRVTMATALVVGALLGCGSDGECRDDDLDGFGAGCEAGADCDDTHPLRNTDCEAVPPPDCNADPSATGCPCAAGSLIACYPGPEGTEGVGRCAPGTAQCIGGHWGLCAGAVLPSAELCDGRDDDCDGIVDEGVRSPCGGCDPACVGGVWGEGAAPFEADPDRGTDVLSSGALTLDRGRIDAPTVWIANTEGGTLSKIDAAAVAEVARYDTGGVEPSRVAVDYDGDAWVTHRALGAVPSVTKVVSDPARCVDGDGDGLETSSGPADVLPAGEDECVAFEVPVGGEGAVARALAVDGTRGTGESGGNVWVGLEQGQAIVELDGDTGAELDRVSTPGFGPFEAAIDPWGTVWMISRDGQLARIDRRVRPLEAQITEVPYPCFLLYGLTADREGRLMMTGFSCDHVLVHDPAEGHWWRVETPQSPRGAAVDGEAGWVAHADGRLSRIAFAPPGLEATVDLWALGASPIESIGVGVDSLGGVWVASTQGGTGGLGMATRVDAASAAVSDQLTVGLGPHVQGDLTGSERLGGFVPDGEASHVFAGCDRGETRWLRLHLDADAGAAGTVRVEARHAADRASLDAAPFAPVLPFPDQSPPVEVDLPTGGVVEVRLVLETSARDGAPRVYRVGLEWECGRLG